MNRNRRSLVLTNEAARHPFRMGLPPQAQAKVASQSRRLAFGRDDWRNFLAAYCATFVVVSLFII